VETPLTGAEGYLADEQYRDTFRYACRQPAAYPTGTT
jgi:hypothetical protein